MKSVHFYVGITGLESIFSIKSFNINVVYLSFSHSPTLSLTIFRSANSELYFQHNFLTWSKWRQRRKWLEVTKQNSGKEHTDNARKKNEREKDERIVGTGFMHHEISILISMLTQNFIWKELSIFFLLFITCAIRRGRLIPLFLFREKGKCVDLDVDAAFSHVILYLSSACCSCFGALLLVLRECDKFACDKKRCHKNDYDDDETKGDKSQ